MNRMKSGAILLVVAVLMNVIGRFLPQSDTRALAALYAIWMISSLIIGLFGLYRLAAGGMKKGS